MCCRILCYIPPFILHLDIFPPPMMKKCCFRLQDEVGQEVPVADRATELWDGVDRRMLPGFHDLFYDVEEPNWQASFLLEALVMVYGRFSPDSGWVWFLQ